MKYDRDYFELMKRQNSDTAMQINNARWVFVAEVAPLTVLDYGSGLNFLSQYGPIGVEVDSYDIGEIDGKPYPQTGILHSHYDLICLFDVLEHVDWENVPDWDMLAVLKCCDHAAVAVPILPPNAIMKTWKHYKPGEHLTYFTVDSLIAFFAERDFTCLLRYGMPECPPREDIHSFLFRKV